MGQIAENIEDIRRGVKNLLKDLGREDEVTLIAVTKTVELPKMQEAIRCGITDIGENRVQEIERKYEGMSMPLHWHLIGTLQTNKVKYIIDKVHLIHSLDRLSLAEEIDRRAKEKGIHMNCLVQVNISKEDSKHGVQEDEAGMFIREISQRYENIRILGLMGMAPFELECEATRPYFRTLKRIFDEIATQEIPRVQMKHLSMGMSNDYRIALEEGSNMIRVGTAIFGERL